MTITRNCAGTTSSRFDVSSPITCIGGRQHGQLVSSLTCACRAPRLAPPGRLTSIMRSRRRERTQPALTINRACTKVDLQPLFAPRSRSTFNVTAGHNALRGSGPGQLHAFDDAVAHVEITIESMAA